MIVSEFNLFAYHTYPAPSWDTDGNGGIYNNSWPWLSVMIQDAIYSGMNTMITEFGWNPGQMRRFRPGVETAPFKNCWYTGVEAAQYNAWPTTGQPQPDGGCYTEDGRSHTFAGDISFFLANERYWADVVAVWIVRGWTDPADPRFPGDLVGTDRVNGVDDYGNVRPWLSAYQQSSP